MGYAIETGQYTKEFHDTLHKRWSQRSINLYLVAAAPKSGSTWCAEFLADYLGCQTMFAGKVPGRVEQDLDDTWLTQMAEGSTAVIHQHCRWHQVTEAYISALRIRPVALLRNASDTVMSVRDHLKVRGGNWPFGFVDHSHIDLSPLGIKSLEMA